MGRMGQKGPRQAKGRHNFRRSCDCPFGGSNQPDSTTGHGSDSSCSCCTMDLIRPSTHGKCSQAGIICYSDKAPHGDSYYPESLQLATACTVGHSMSMQSQLAMEEQCFSSQLHPSACMLTWKCHRQSNGHPEAVPRAGPRQGDMPCMPEKGQRKPQ